MYHEVCMYNIMKLTYAVWELQRNQQEEESK